MTNKEDSIKTAAQRWASEQQMYQQYRVLWMDGKDNKGDPMRDRLHAMKIRGPRAEELCRRGTSWPTSGTSWWRSTAPTRWRRRRTMRIANEFGGHPDEALGVGKNAHLNDTLENMQAREVHPELQRKFKALHPEWQAHPCRGQALQGRPQRDPRDQRAELHRRDQAARGLHRRASGQAHAGGQAH